MNSHFSDEQQRAWAALDLGPLYVSREQAAEQGNDQPALSSQPEVVSVVSEESVPLQKLARTELIKANVVQANAVTQLSPTWDGLREQVAQCKSCNLCESRKQTVFSGGAFGANLLIIGEAPGEEEDRTGEPFVGQAGQLLTSMLKAIGLDRQVDTLILNSLKCRPPANRNPAPEEMAACKPFLIQQIELARPKVILLTGKFAAMAILGLELPIGTLREQSHQFKFADGTIIPVLVSYHPAYYLRRLSEKSKGWADLLKLRALLRLALP
jgi:uracil-DNA glycosylase